MILNIYKVQNGAWQSIQAIYPVKFTNRLDLEFDSGAFNSYHLGEKDIKPYTLVKIEVGDTANSLDTFYFYTTPSESWKPTDSNQIAWNLVEPSKELQGIFLDGVSSTFFDGQTKSLLSVVQRLLRITPLRKEGQTQKYTLDQNADLIERLTANSPEFRWSTQTSLWEALVDIGACIDAIPRLTANGTKCNVITFDLVNTLGDKTSTSSFVGRLRAVDEQQYCSALEANTQNLVTADEDEGSLVYPAPNAFATPRTEDIQLTDQNCELILAKPIADVSKFEYDASNKTMLAYTFVPIGGGEYEKDFITDVTLDELGLGVLDMTSMLFDFNEWQTLPTEKVDDGSQLLNRVTKNNTFYYQRYSNKIVLKNSSYKGASSFFGEGIWNIVINSVLAQKIKFWEFGNSNTNVFDYQIDYSKAYYKQDGTPFWIGKTNGYFLNEYETDLKTAGFRLTYKPLNNSVKIRAKKTKPQGFDYVQPYNQRAEMNNSVPFGQNMLTTANRLGVETQKLVEYARSWATCKKVGDKVNGFVVTSVEYNVVARDTIECVIMLSKEWSYLSQWYAIDKKFRSWNIPADYTLRNLYYADKVRITTTAKDTPTNTSSLTNEGVRVFMNTFTSAVDSYSEINNVWLTNIEGQTANVVNATSFGFANSITLHGEMKDNLSAGITTQTGVERYNVDSYYANADGSMEHANIVFGGAIASVNRDKLPSAVGMNLVQTPLIELNYLLVEKDAGEQIAVTYQLMTDKDESLIVGDELFASNQLCRQRTSAPQIKLYGLTQAFATVNENILPTGAEELSQNISVTVQNNYGSLTIPQIDNKYVGWAIAVDGKILLGSKENRKAQQTVYFYFENDLGAGTDAPDIEYEVTITYQLKSPQGKANRTFAVKHRSGEPFTIADDLYGKTPDHFAQGAITVNGQTIGATYTANIDTTIDVALTFVPFNATFTTQQAITEVPARNSTQGLYGVTSVPMVAISGGTTFKPNRQTWIDFPSASDGYVEYFAPNDNLADYWQAVVYVQPTTSATPVEPFFYLVDCPLNASYSVLINGQNGTTTYTNQARVNRFYPSTQVSNSVCKYVLSLQEGALGIEIPHFGTIYDYNGGINDDNLDWQYSKAKFKFGTITQVVDNENQL